MLNRRSFVGLVAGMLAFLGRKPEVAASTLEPSRLGGFSFVEYRRSDGSILVRLRKDWGLIDLQAVADKYAYMGAPRAVVFSYEDRRRFLAIVRGTDSFITLTQTPAGQRDLLQIDGAGPSIEVSPAPDQGYVRFVYGV